MVNGAGVVAAIESAVVSSGEDKHRDKNKEKDKDKPSKPGKPKWEWAPEETEPSENTNEDAQGRKPSSVQAEDWSLALTLGHLETRMHAARVVESGIEYKQALLVYAKRLADEGFKGFAEEVVRELMGPVYWWVISLCLLIRVSGLNGMSVQATGKWEWEGGGVGVDGGGAE